jgi:alanine racemase
VGATNGNARRRLPLASVPIRRAKFTCPVAISAECVIRKRVFTKKYFQLAFDHLSELRLNLIQEINLFKNRIEIEAEKYRRNLRFFTSRLEKGVDISLVVKANAYGHGLKEIVSLASEEGLRNYSVHTLEEALVIKDTAPESSILIMGYLAPDEIENAVENEFEMTCFNTDFPAAVNRAAGKMNKEAKLHLKIETGTNRLGLNQSELENLVSEISGLNNITVKGIYTHFANIEDTTDHSFAQAQLKKFIETKSLMENLGLEIPVAHTACSAAVLLFPQTHFQMVRLGISQYGLWPSRETYLSYLHRKKNADKNVLLPILNWKTRVAQIKEVKEGEFIGYGCTYKVSRKSRIAVLPVGYSDGYDRKLSNKGYVLIAGKRAPVRGRVCMNLFMVDVTDIPEAKVNDEAVLMGNQGNETISPELFAGWADTIHYEAVARINPLIPRVIV